MASVKMKLSIAIALISQLAISSTAHAFTVNTQKSSVAFTAGYIPQLDRKLRLSAVPPPGGLSFEEDKATIGIDDKLQKASSDTVKNEATTSTPQPENSANPLEVRGKLNEIDFCMSPTDVSLSRLYNTNNASSSTFPNKDSSINGQGSSERDRNAPVIMSLTRALNNASNRAVRRILLSRSWPSPEALNMSLRQVLAAGKTNANASAENSDSKAKDIQTQSIASGSDQSDSSGSNTNSENSAKCPVPRPILNVIMKEADKSKISASEATATDGQAPEVTSSTPLGRKGRTDEEWVEDQLTAFRETYGQNEGYDDAEAFMECILNLATSGVESSRVSQVSFCNSAMRNWFYIINMEN